MCVHWSGEKCWSITGRGFSFHPAHTHPTRSTTRVTERGVCTDENCNQLSWDMDDFSARMEERDRENFFGVSGERFVSILDEAPRIGGPGDARVVPELLQHGSNIGVRLWICWLVLAREGASPWPVFGAPRVAGSSSAEGGGGSPP